ncbi:hypothetical protein PGT21_028917 [Puccinia graminis f. sp. tritici]|uniref:Uncharacterized protein n=1 Tax=Puccinia graminis f. sp. tritici TaxID=56615 RepID=A0A5B0NZN9_PUCGR|nr:hypothetical protein PGT21_028917 [Puccinia graminis f. sp. tritici]KAA1121574.1 hypothetical protein PGTUg99_032533 [Puccinia graminis f. sp. tritici]
MRKEVPIESSFYTHSLAMGLSISARRRKNYQKEIRKRSQSTHPEGQATAQPSKSDANDIHW